MRGRQSHDGIGMIRSRKSYVLVLLLIAAGLTLLSLRSSPTPYVPLPQSTEEQRIPLTSEAHPIHKLVTENEAGFKKLLDRQSKTLEEAVAEYRRRYGMPPPPNFDIWFRFAQRRNVQLIDEFDTIYDSILPFWALDPKTIRDRTKEALGFDNALIACLIRDGHVAKAEGGGDGYKWHREALPVMMEGFINYLPDMDLAFNIHDEPRIVMQNDDLARHVNVAKTQKIPLAFNNKRLKNKFSPRPEDMGDGQRIKEVKTTRFNRYAHQPTWGDSRLSCSPDSAARRSLNDSSADDKLAYTEGLPLNFIANMTAFSDICNSPSMEKSFGFFDRPNAFDVAHELFPIFSQSKVSSFQDILYPSPWYYMKKVSYSAWRDTSWDKKTDTMFWRGSTTGGFSRDGGWRRQHRQRFIQRIMPHGKTDIMAYDNDTHLWTEKEIDMKDMAHYFDVKFTLIGQCDPGDCDAQREYFGTVEPVNMFDAFGAKYLLDIDGNAFSGRYYAWLQSKSLVYKLAVFREWHDEWLMPWVHFVPLSLHGDEYAESIRYFDQEDLGKVQAQRLAEQGREWAGNALRNEDLETWFFRLLLEYGRVIDDDRENIGFQI